VQIFTISKHPFDIAIQSTQHPDARMHHRPAALGRHDQGFDRGLPLLEILLGLRQLLDIVRAGLEGDELAGPRTASVSACAPVCPWCAW